MIDNLQVGDHVIVLEHWRDSGWMARTGGWRDYEHEHRIVKVNKTTVMTERFQPATYNSEAHFYKWGKVSKDRILRKCKEAAQ